MPYSDPIDPATPGDLDIAGQGDDRIRELKRALIERIESFFESVDDDPWQPKDDVITEDSIAAGSVTETKLGEAAVTEDKIHPDVQALWVKIHSASATWAASEGVISEGFREYDVAVAGAKIGDPVFCRFGALSGVVYPTHPPTDPANGAGSVQDVMTLNAWCLEDDVVRIRLGNPTAGTVTPSGNRPIDVFVLSF